MLLLAELLLQHIQYVNCPIHFNRELTLGTNDALLKSWSPNAFSTHACRCTFHFSPIYAKKNYCN